jgi:hypothetical protein
MSSATKNDQLRLEAGKTTPQAKAPSPVTPITIVSPVGIQVRLKESNTRMSRRIGQNR